MSTLALVHELQRRDDVVAAALAEVELLAAEAERLRGRAGELDVFVADAPQERRRRAELASDARARFEEANAGLAGAEEQVSRARERGRGRDLDDAERFAAHARETVRSAAAALELAGSAAIGFDRELEEAERRVGEVETEAAAVAARVAELPRLAPEARIPPGRGLDAVAAWSAQVRGALLVLRAGLTAEREALVREANELAAAALGEAVQPANIARVREQLINALGEPAP